MCYENNRTRIVLFIRIDTWGNAEGWCAVNIRDEKTVKNDFVPKAEKSEKIVEKPRSYQNLKSNFQ